MKSDAIISIEDVVLGNPIVKAMFSGSEFSVWNSSGFPAVLTLNLELGTNVFDSIKQTVNNQDKPHSYVHANLHGTTAILNFLSKNTNYNNKFESIVLKYALGSSNSETYHKITNSFPKLKELPAQGLGAN